MNTEQSDVQPGGCTIPVGSASRKRRGVKDTGKPFGGTMNGPEVADKRLEASASIHPVYELFSLGLESCPHRIKISIITPSAPHLA
jgi:hypothetical protein